ncbi:hypothetical protein V1511DRAFT_521702 [Dipodascopsis uninucleata]
MKFTTISSLAIASLAGVASVSGAAVAFDRRELSSHRHRHAARHAKADRRSAIEQDLNKRAVDIVYTVVTVVVDTDGNTVYPSSTADLQQVSNAVDAVPTTIYVAPTSSSVYVAPSSSSVYIAPSSTLVDDVAPTTSSIAFSSASPTSFSTSTDTTPSTTSSAGSSTATLAWYEDPTEAFVDGTIPCSEFPSGQGVVALDWLEIGGWSSIAISDQDGAGQATSCGEGNLCSYACQPGMSKTQWPENQPADGESRGGLLCSNGYLTRTRTSTDYLCVWGQPSVNVVSEISDVVSICRTDYPGNENMVIPTVVDGGATQPLTVVDEENYYMWQGKMTSAQFYVNKAGYTEDYACVWGEAGDDFGNWSPLNFGGGYVDGITYIGIIPNPNNLVDTLNYNIKIVAADDSSTVLGDCEYINGVIYSSGVASPSGCTASVTSGSANIVLYN